MPEMSEGPARPVRRPGNCFGCGLLVVIAVSLTGIIASATWKGSPGLRPAGDGEVLSGIERPAAVFLSGGIVRSGVYFGHEEHIAEGLHCDECHGEGEHQRRPEDVPALCAQCHTEHYTEADWCRRCHLDRAGIRPADHQTDSWGRSHGGSATCALTTHGVSISCDTCHPNGESCRSCHRVPLPHPEGFAANHKSAAWAGRGDCAQCHEESTCDACHDSSEPASHAAEPFEHWKPDILSASRCETCHEGSCDSCHKTRKPPSHVEGWRHGKAALEPSSHCGFCHRDSTCTDCHVLEMPHSGSFFAKHGEQDASQCGRCHQDRTTCLECHRLVLPTSHRDASWAKEHGDNADRASCAACHEEPVCAACHGLELPHADDFLVEHGEPAYERSETCAKCHDRAECLACHSEMKPSDHTEEFIAAHGERATGHEAYCLLCHDKAEFCGQCHAE